MREKLWNCLPIWIRPNISYRPASTLICNALVVLCCYSSMVANFDCCPYKNELIVVRSPDLGAHRKGGGRGIIGFRSVSDAEWHSELLHYIQPVQSKQAAVSALSLICWFPQPSVCWLYSKHTLPPKITESILSCMSNMFFSQMNSQKIAFQLG